MKTSKLLFTLAFAGSILATQGCTQNETIPATNYEIVGCETLPAEPLKSLPWLQKKIEESNKDYLLEIGSYKYRNSIVYVEKSKGYVSGDNQFIYDVYDCTGKSICISFLPVAIYDVNIGKCWKEIQKELKDYKLIYKK